MGYCGFLAWDSQHCIGVSVSGMYGFVAELQFVRLGVHVALGICWIAIGVERNGA